jgi:two-component system chemotaxis sensor kinase CheA
MLVESNMVDSRQVEAVLAEQQHLKELKQKEQQKEQADTASSIRVASDKLDSLVNLVGEMLTHLPQLFDKTTNNTTEDSANTVLINDFEKPYSKKQM